MTTSEAATTTLPPEENLETITALLVAFFEGDPTVGAPCISSIDQSLKRIARALEVYAGIVGVANRLERVETGMDFVSTQLAAMIDTLSLNVERAHRGVPPTSAGNRS